MLLFKDNPMMKKKILILLFKYLFVCGKESKKAKRNKHFQINFFLFFFSEIKRSEMINSCIFIELLIFIREIYNFPFFLKKLFFSFYFWIFFCTFFLSFFEKKIIKGNLIKDLKEKKWNLFGVLSFSYFVCFFKRVNFLFFFENELVKN